MDVIDLIGHLNTLQFRQYKIVKEIIKRKAVIARAKVKAEKIFEERMNLLINQRKSHCPCDFMSCSCTSCSSFQRELSKFNKIIDVHNFVMSDSRIKIQKLIGKRDVILEEIRNIIEK